MRFRVLGAAAGGGVPQWNCGCRQCVAARDGKRGVSVRLQASISMNAGDDAWTLVNATSDIRAQMAATPALWPRAGSRRAPIGAILLTDAQLDHVVGLLELRQAEELTVLAPAAVVRAVRDDLGFGRVLDAYVRVDWRSVPVGSPEPLAADVTFRAVAAGGAQPRYVGDVADGVGDASRSGAAPGGDSAGHVAVGAPAPWSVAYEFRAGSGRSLVYAPTVGAITPSLVEACRRADAVLFDGTFWSDDEPVRAGIGARRSRDFGHVPVSGDGGSLELVASRRGRFTAYTHLNNSNPLLDPRSEASRALAAAGVCVAADGQEIEL